MQGLPTILLFTAFIVMCLLLFFLKDSKTYDEAARAPLDDDIKEQLSKPTNEEQS